jgi:hypothetical protein
MMRGSTPALAAARPEFPLLLSKKASRLRPGWLKSAQPLSGDRAHGRLHGSDFPYNWLDTDGAHAFGEAFDMLYALGHRRLSIVDVNHALPAILYYPGSSPSGFDCSGFTRWGPAEAS